MHAIRSNSHVVGLIVLSVAAAALLLRTAPARAADHNDPIAINSIFDDVPSNAADLYDLFGFPSDDKTGGEKVVIALTFAAVPSAGAFDPDMLYIVKIKPDPRVERPAKGDWKLEDYLAYAREIDDRYVNLKASEIRVQVSPEGKATLHFIGFPAADSFTQVIDTNKAVTIQSPDGYAIKTFVGGRDDAFFNDLTGFFRSINYAPQFYKVPQGAPRDLREVPIPKTLLQLDGNKWFNADAIRIKDGPDKGVDPGQRNTVTGRTVKLPLPSEPMTWTGNKFYKDADGDYRFVYSGKDAQAGLNANAIVLEIPLAFLTKSPQTDRIVNTWGESLGSQGVGEDPLDPERPAAAALSQATSEPDPLGSSGHRRVVARMGNPARAAAGSDDDDDRVPTSARQVAAHPGDRGGLGGHHYRRRRMVILGACHGRPGQVAPRGRLVRSAVKGLQADRHRRRPVLRRRTQRTSR